ncbi:hypothetical protein [Aliikangiella sp. IMCC44359]|uniref:hypothetical protein n=1 Tax=Aliikangiella sp. IMCC44359 TaxID=3459125 RepID=UPI00403A840A
MQTSTSQAIHLPYPMNYHFHQGEISLTENSVMAERLFDESELVFEGHFPQNKILPGVMLIEYALYLGEVYLKETNDIRLLSEVVSARFLSPVTPGMKVVCQCDFTDNKDVLSMKSTLSYGEVKFAKVKVNYSRRDL